jgi:hypothetical protein
MSVIHSPVANVLEDNGYDGDYDLTELSAEARKVLHHATTSIRAAKSKDEVLQTVYVTSLALMPFDLHPDRDTAVAHLTASARNLFGVTRHEIQQEVSREVHDVLDRRAATSESQRARNKPDDRQSRLITISAADQRPRNINFVWSNGDGKQGGRLARGKHTSFAGEGGLGKSTLMVGITAIITTGGLWPCDEGRSPIGDVIALSAEDGVNDVLVPRLMAAGADMDRVHIVQGVAVADGKRRRFNLLDDLDKIERLIGELRQKGHDVVLVWIDPVSSYMGKVDSHNNTALRGVLDPISEMAERTEVAFASVTHFNKGAADKGFKAVHRVMGGGAFVHAPRVAFAVVQDPDDENRRLLLHLKNNLGPKPQGLAYVVTSRVVGADDRTGQDVWGSCISWASDPVLQTADDVLGNDKDDPTITDDAVDFLRTVLADGPMLVAVIEQSARAAGLLKEGQPISQCKPFRRARAQLGIKPYQPKREKDPGWLWTLNGGPDAL